jgi:hypothetical protein
MSNNFLFENSDHKTMSYITSVVFMYTTHDCNETYAATIHIKKSEDMFGGCNYIHIRFLVIYSVFLV